MRTGKDPSEIRASVFGHTRHGSGTPFLNQACNANMVARLLYTISPSLGTGIQWSSISGQGAHEQCRNFSSRGQLQSPNLLFGGRGANLGERGIAAIIFFSKLLL
jgi:hypothetical protein